MNRAIKKVFTIIILLMFTLLSAEIKEKMPDDFLKLNPNIQNEELRIELEGLRVEFNTERKKIQFFYTEKIEALKIKQRNKIKNMKTAFGERRAIIMKKYTSEKRANSAVKSMHTPSVVNNPEQKKDPKGKKNNRKP